MDHWWRKTFPIPIPTYTHTCTHTHTLTHMKLDRTSRFLAPDPPSPHRRNSCPGNFCLRRLLETFNFSPLRTPHGLLSSPGPCLLAFRESSLGTSLLPNLYLAFVVNTYFCHHLQWLTEVKSPFTEKSQHLCSTESVPGTPLNDSNKTSLILTATPRGRCH